MKYYHSTFFKKFSSNFISAVLILFILGLINYLAYMNPKQFDMTAQKWNSLSSETLNILNKMDGELTIHLFGKKNQERAMHAFVDRYRFEKNDIEILFHDVQTRPDLVKKYKITKNGVLVLDYKTKTVTVANITELEMAKSMVKLNRVKDPIVYYLSGLNNLDLESSQAQGGVILKNSLLASSYQLEIHNIQSLSNIPKDVKALIIWGPKVDLSKEQIGIVDSYLMGGGTLITAIDPNFNVLVAPEYRKYLDSKGIDISNNIVIDNKSSVNGSKGIVPLVEKINTQHEIVSSQPVPVFLPLTSSVMSSSVAQEEFTALIQTSLYPASWAESNTKSYISKKHQFDQGEDHPGPVTIAAAIENKKENWRITAFGSSSFVQNSYGNYTNNFRLFTGSLAWLVEKNNNLILNLPVFKEKPIFISAPQIGIIFYFSVVFVPLLLCGAAIYSYRRRQKV